MKGKISRSSPLVKYKNELTQIQDYGQFEALLKLFIYFVLHTE
jgi:hypothetical protein